MVLNFIHSINIPFYDVRKTKVSPLNFDFFQISHIRHSLVSLYIQYGYITFMLSNRQLINYAI